MNHDIKASDFFDILERLPLEYSPDKEVMLRKLEEEEKLEVIRKRLSYYRSKESGVPRFLWNDSLTTYHPRTEEEKTNYEKILSFVTNDENHSTLILTGRCGTGKSHLGAGIINSLGGKMIDADTLLLQVDSGDNFKSSENKLEILSRFSNYKLLVIDEIGRSMDVIKEKGYLSYIIRNRYNNRLPTVLISNLNKKELLKFFGEAIFDRFQETCIYLEFTGESYRPNKRDITL